MATRGMDLNKLRKICLSLPDTKETITWGEPHYRVGDKIFAGFGEEDGAVRIGFKLDKDHARALVTQPGFRPSKYVGKHGWVTMDETGFRDWEQMRDYILESYRLIAPKRTLAKLKEGVIPPASPRRRKPSGAGRKTATRKLPASATSARKKAPR